MKVHLVGSYYANGKEMFTLFVMGHYNMELSRVPFFCAVICRRHGTVLIWHFWFSQCCC